MTTYTCVHIWNKTSTPTHWLLRHSVFPLSRRKYPEDSCRIRLRCYHAITIISPTKTSQLRVIIVVDNALLTYLYRGRRYTLLSWNVGTLKKNMLVSVRRRFGGMCFAVFSVCFVQCPLWCYYYFYVFFIVQESRALGFCSYQKWWLSYLQLVSLPLNDSA